MKHFDLRSVAASLIDVIWAGLLWIVCSLPILTLGASTTALYYTVVKCVRHGRGNLTGSFFKAFGSNFRQATLLWLLMLLWLFIGLTDLYCLRYMGLRPGHALYSLSCLLLLPIPVLFPWLFAFLSRFHNTLGGTLKCAAFLALRHIGVTLLLLAELVGSALLCWLVPQLIPLLPGLLCLLMSLSVEPVFRTLTEDQTEGDDWYNE